MSDKEEILAEMRQIVSALQEGRKDPATFDEDKVKQIFKDELAKLQEARAEEKRDKTPVRLGQPISKEGQEVELKNNRYAHEVKEIRQTGKFKGFLGTEHKAIDFYLADRLMQHVYDDAQRKGVSAYDRGKINPPSEDLKAAVKALSSTGSATGDELVPTNFATELWEDVHLANVLVSNLVRMPMTSNPQTIPNALGDVTFYKGSENTAFTSSDPATSNQNLTVTELGAEVDWSYTLEEDAVVAMMPAVRMTLTRNAAEYMDGFCFRADSTATSSNINTDSTPGSNAWYLSDGQDGIWHQTNVDNTSNETNANAALTDVHLRGAVAGIAKYGARKQDLLWIMDIETYLDGMLDATTSNAPGTFLASQSNVNYSVIVQGEVDQYRGIPIVTPTLAVKTQADGTISDTAASNTDGVVSLINRTQWKVGFLRDLLVEVDRDIQKRQTIMVVSFRIAIGARGTRSSLTHTWGIRGVTV